MMRSFFALALVGAMAAACGERSGGQGGGADSGSGQARGAGGGARSSDAVWAVGSSTVFPFSSRVAETFAQKTRRPAPRVESLGTGGGIKLFCSGVGGNTPDIADASRPMTASEFDQCAANGVREIVEVPIGFDGVVIAQQRAGPAFDLQLQDVYRALAASTPAPGGSFVDNANQTWRQVNARLPDQRIRVYGPPPTSGTRDAFVELGLEAGAKAVPALAALSTSDPEAFKTRAGRIREDGAWIDAGENDNAMVQILEKTPGALGVFGYSFLEQNRDRVKAALINGVGPNPQTIQDGSYPLARTLFIYVKKAHVGVTPGLSEFVQEYLSDAASGRGGYLQDRGLIQLHPDELAATRRVATELTPMARPAP